MSHHRPQKYPRTPYWPSSPGRSNDALTADPRDFLGAELVFTEKLDGSNVLLHKGQAYARSASPGRQGWLGMVKKHHAWKTARHPGLQIYGEDLYGVHSIRYNALPENHTLRLFGARDRDGWLPWDQLVHLAASLDIPTVPLLHRHTTHDPHELDRIIQILTGGASALGTQREGVVIRHAGRFSNQDFQKRVCKSVRANHVQVDEEHWSRAWEPAKLLPAAT